MVKLDGISSNSLDVNSKDNKHPIDDQETKMTKNDAMLDKIYSKPFNAKFYTKKEIPKRYLPYGLISHPKKYLKKVSRDTNKIEWTMEVYNDCLKYIRHFGGAKSESEWKNSFIVFTNLQIAFYNYPNLIKNDIEFDLISDYTRKHLKNLRTYVAKNAHLFLECLIFCLDDQERLDNLSFKLIPELLVCTGSEKSIYRDSSKINLKLLTFKSSKYFNQEILRIFFEHSKSLNKKISSTAGEFAVYYFINATKDNLDVLDIDNFIQNLNFGFGVKNVEVKKHFKNIVISLPYMFTKDKLDLFFKESSKYPFIVDIIKKELPAILLI